MGTGPYRWVETRPDEWMAFEANREVVETNLIGALRRSMATCGFLDLAEFNRAEIAIASVPDTTL